MTDITYIRFQQLCHTNFKDHVKARRRMNYNRKISKLSALSEVGINRRRVIYFRKFSYHIQKYEEPIGLMLNRLSNSCNFKSSAGIL